MKSFYVVYGSTELSRKGLALKTLPNKYFRNIRNISFMKPKVAIMGDKGTLPQYYCLAE